jgi:RNA polymerase sigma-70 factor (ECF subfamily)
MLSPRGAPVLRHAARGHVEVASAVAAEDDPSDDELVLRIGRGDRDAFHVLVERHLARLVGFAGRLLHDRSSAEDVAQETFLRLWTAAPRWRPTGARVGSWLHRVALNLCRDRRARRPEPRLDDVPEPVDPAPSGVGIVQRREVGEVVQRALAGLPEGQRVAITLCHFQGLRNVEAADVMDVSVEALESLLARGRRALRERLRALAPALLGDA